MIQADSGLVLTARSEHDRDMQLLGPRPLVLLPALPLFLLASCCGDEAPAGERPALPVCSLPSLAAAADEVGPPLPTGIRPTPPELGTGRLAVELPGGMAALPQPPLLPELFAGLTDGAPGALRGALGVCCVEATAPLDPQHHLALELELARVRLRHRGDAGQPRSCFAVPAVQLAQGDRVAGTVRQDAERCRGGLLFKVLPIPVPECSLEQGQARTAQGAYHASPLRIAGTGFVVECRFDPRPAPVALALADAGWAERCRRVRLDARDARWGDPVVLLGGQDPLVAQLAARLGPADPRVTALQARTTRFGAEFRQALGAWLGRQAAALPAAGTPTPGSEPGVSWTVTRPLNCERTRAPRALVAQLGEQEVPCTLELEARVGAGHAPIRLGWISSTNLDFATLTGLTGGVRWLEASGQDPAGSFELAAGQQVRLLLGLGLPAPMGPQRLLLRIVRRGNPVLLRTD